jgi:hypothetical protein
VLAEHESKTVAQTMPKLGTYEVGVRMLDYRDDLSRARAKRTGDTATQELARQVQNDRAWFTAWEKRPLARIEARVNGAPTRSLIFKQLGSSLELDASNSSFPDAPQPAKYQWEVCRLYFGRCDDPKMLQGDTLSTRNVSFGSYGEYIVKLTLTDAYGQVDESQRYVVVKNGGRAFFRSRVDYPIQPSPEARGAELKPNNDQFDNDDFTFEKALRLKRDNGVDIVEDYFPIVLYKKAQLTRIATRWNDWSNGANFKSQLCASVKVFHKGIEWPSTIFPKIEDPSVPTWYDPFGWWTVPPPDYNNPTFCDFVVTRAGGLGLENSIFRRSNNEFLITGSSWFQTIGYDMMDGLRVPEVVMSILPDEALPGDAFMADSSIKAVEESFTMVNGVKTMLLTVRMRRSDLENNRLTFDIPVYAVNPDGKVMTQTHGNFYAKFQGLRDDEQSCGDCVMVNGKAKIRVTINPQEYILRNGSSARRLDTSSILMGSDAAYKNGWDCSSTDSDLSRESGHFLAGCADAMTSSELPTGFEDVEPNEIEELSNARAFFGVILFGETAEAANKFLDYLKEGFWKG